MQIVLSGNRVIAYGDNCFLAMGGTVICEETGKAYSNATVAEVDVLPADIDRVGYEYHAGVFVPCAPYGMDNGNGTILVACEDCKAPKDSGLRIDEIIGARLYVTAPAGCEVICTNGDKTVKGIYKNGVYVCNLTDYGEWTVTAGRWHGLVYESGSDTVTVDIVKQYTLSLGATISVEYPKGSTVTCTHGDVVLTAPDTSGVWELDVLAFGEWELYCTNGTDETSRKFTVSEGGQTETIILAYFAAYIVVTYPANSTCACSDGVTTFTDTNSTDAEKTATFTVPNAGTWTITATATDGSGYTANTTVSIAESPTTGQSVSKELSYALYIFKEGTGRNVSYPITTYEVEIESANEIGTNNSGAGSAYCTKSKIDVSGYSKLHVDMVCTGQYNSSYTGTVGVGNDASTGVDSMGSFSASKTGIYNTNRTVHTVDISSVNTAVYIKIGLYAVAHRIYNWWLE